ncbi:MAG: type II secretion system protein GspK [Mariprofundaceae bacterium]
MSVCKDSRGIVLVIVLCALVLLTVIASGLAFDVKTESRMVDATVSLAKADAYAEAGLNRGLYELYKPVTDPRRWQVDGRPYLWQFDGVEITIRLSDLAGKIDLNKGSDALLLGAFRVAGLDATAARTLLHVIQDWRDGDELVRAFGAESRDYKQASLATVPSNAPFATLSELKNVMGMTYELYKKLEPMLTVHSFQPGVYAAVATRDVLMAIPGLSGEQVDEYLVMRDLAVENSAPLPILNVGQGFIARYLGRSYVIEAEVVMSDELKNVRQRVVRRRAAGSNTFSVIERRAIWL